MTSPSKAHNADSLSLATRYSLLRGRHLSMEKYWNERHCNDKKYIQQLEQRNAALLEMLQLAQNEINLLKQRAQNPSINEQETAHNEAEEASTINIMTQKKSLNLQNEYKKLIKHKLNKSMERQNLFYEVLRECLFLSDPYNIRVLLKRSKTKHNNNSSSSSRNKNEHKNGELPLQSALSTILKLRKQIDYECDCFSIHSNDSMPNCSYSTRLILMRNSLIICGVGLSSKYSTNESQSGKALATLPNIEIELYTIAGIYICNNDPYSYCTSMIIACSKDLTLAAHGINPLHIKQQQQNNDVIRYKFSIFSDSKKLIHALTERLPDYVWHINNNQNMDKTMNYHNMEIKQDDNEAASSMVGRLGAGLYAGITGVVMDPIRGGQNDGMKGFLRGIASGISGVAIKPITHFRSNSNNDSNTNILSPPIKKKTEQKEDIRSALNIPDSPLVFQAESMSESESITSSTITTNTLDSSRSEQSANVANNNNNNNDLIHQSQIFAKHKLMQRQQYLNTINTTNKQSKTEK